MTRSKSQQIKDRLASQGLIRTGAYLFGSMVLPRLGMERKIIYQWPPGSPAHAPLPQGISLTHLTGMEQLQPGDIGALLDFEGQPLLDRFESDFASGGRCLIARGSSGELLSLCWLAPAPIRLTSRSNDLLIRDCFTLPVARGKGLYRHVLRDACRWVAENAGPAKLFITSVFTNRPSIRAIESCGFVRVGTYTRVGNWRRTRVHPLDS